jgi:hypothetical protein
VPATAPRCVNLTVLTQQATEEYLLSVGCAAL